MEGRANKILTAWTPMMVVSPRINQLPQVNRLRTIVPLQIIVKRTTAFCRRPLNRLVPLILVDLFLIAVRCSVLKSFGNGWSGFKSLPGFPLAQELPFIYCYPNEVNIHLFVTIVSKF